MIEHILRFLRGHRKREHIARQEHQQMARMTGVVKFFNQVKSFGFITLENGEDVFVHQNQITVGSLTKGDRVEFDVEQRPKGLTAQNVVKLL